MLAWERQADVKILARHRGRSPGDPARDVRRALPEAAFAGQTRTLQSTTGYEPGHHLPDLRFDTSMNRRLFEIGSMTGATGSALASGAASICCVGPIAITILGVQGAIWAAGVKPYRYYLLAGSLLFIGLAFQIVYRPPKFIAAASCSTRVGRFTKVLMWGSGAVWLAALVLNIAIDQTGL